MAQGIYIYGIAAAGEVNATGVGIEDAAIAVIEHNGLAAVTSRLDIAGRLRPQRKHLAAHQAVLREAGERTTVLPMAFGVVADDEAGVRTLLDEHAEALDAELSRVAGCVEMGLTLSWAVENVFEQFVLEHPQLRGLRDELVRLGEAAPHDLRVQAGRMFSHLLERDREIRTQAVVGAIDGICREIDQGEPKSEAIICKLSCLVDRSLLEAFERAVHECASGFDDRFAFDISGPWQPHSFVRLDLELSGAA